MWNVGEFDIQVDEDGRFFTEKDGRIVRRTSLSALKRLLEKDVKAVPVIVPDRGYSRWCVRRDEIVRIVSGGRLKGKASGTSYQRFDAVYLYHEEKLKALQRLIKEYEALNERWNAVLETMTRVTDKNLNELRGTVEVSNARGAKSNA